MSQLRAENLHLWRAEQHVLRGVSLEVSAGHCLQITGANGAGKTTLLRALCGLIPLESGCVLWQGREVAVDRDAYHAQLEYLGHENGLKAELTAAENLRSGVRLKRSVSAEEIAAALARTGVADSGGALVRRLSAGQRRRVALARLLLGHAVLWVLDEPAANLDQRGHEMLGELVKGHLERGGIAVVATHQALAVPAAQLRSLALQ